MESFNLSMTRQEAEEKLQKSFGISHFYDEQWEVIRKIIGGERVLMIQKTGFGKSLCYQFPATLFAGVTVIFSPLIALMRDQVRNLNQKGIPAKFINSEQSYEENAATIQDTIDGKVKILYVAPERQENQEWLEATHKMNLSMVVIDEAHTISVWGHDFRPAFRRIVNLVKLLPHHLPVLATTATATQRVQMDIKQQIGAGLTTIRGDLCRSNFKLYVIKVHSEDEKMVWLAHNLNHIDGTGLLYTGTRASTEIYANWLKYSGINATYYNAGLDAETRKEIENGLMANKFKCVVSTNALGMGIDKPDIRFIIHTQIPASPIHYYQEIGRAGRDGKPTTLVLFYNESLIREGIEEDFRLPKAFIDSGRPAIKHYHKVIELLKNNPLCERAIIKAANIKSTQGRVILADLSDQGIVRKRDKFYEYQFGAKELDTSAFEKLRLAKLQDLSAMREYIYTKLPRMQYLCDFLDNEFNQQYLNCDNTNLKPLTVTITDEWIKKLSDYRETFFPKLETAKGPIINGVAASYYGVTNVGNALHRSKYENGGDFPDFLLRLTLKAYRKTFDNMHFDLLLFVPPTQSGDLVKNFATKVSHILHIPLSDKLVKTRETQEQKMFQNAYMKKDNITDAFEYAEPSHIKDKGILLIDDIYDSGATIKEIGRLLTKYGATLIAPITIAKTIGGELV